MYFTEALRVLLRRWYVLLAGIAVLGIAALGVVRYVPTQYQASGQLLLVLPVQATGVTTPTNPYLNLQPGLSTTASIVASSISSKDTQRSLADEGFTADYSADVLPGAGPVLVVTTKSAKPANALQTRDEIINRLDKKLARLQSELNVPDAQLIRLLPTNVDTVAEVLPGNKIKALAGAGSAVIVLTLIFAFVLDGWARARQARREALTLKTVDDADSDLEESDPGRRVRVRRAGETGEAAGGNVARVRGESRRRSTRRPQQARR